MTEWDDFESEVKAESGQNVGRCGIRAILDSLDDSARGSVEAALNRPDLTSTAIAVALKKRIESAPSDFTVRRHRNGRCSCPQQDGRS